MSTRKWNRPGIAARIVESALSQPSVDAPDVPDDLRAIDMASLQSLVVRAGRYAWLRQDDSETLCMLSDVFRSALLEDSPDPRAVARAAYARVAAAAMEALALRNDGYQRYAPRDIDELGSAVMSADDGGRGMITAAVVRSMLEPLYGADRAGFRELVGALGGVIGLLDAAGIDGRVPDMIVRPGYQELRALQGFLNGVLRVSRTGHRTPAGELVSAGSTY